MSLTASSLEFEEWRYTAETNGKCAPHLGSSNRTEW